MQQADERVSSQTVGQASHHSDQRDSGHDEEGKHARKEREDHWRKRMAALILRNQELDTEITTLI